MNLDRINRRASATTARYGRLAAAGLAIIVFTSPASGVAASESEWWLPPVEQASSVRSDSREPGNSLQFQQTERKFSTTDEPVRRTAVDRAFSTLHRGSSSLHFASSWTDRERVVGGGVSLGALTAFSIVGSGEKYTETSAQYAGLDPYKFHGGSDTAYQFHGAGLDLRLPGKTSVQAGFATISADRLEVRQANYIGFTSRRYFGRLTLIERGGQTVGHGFDAGVWLGRFRLGYQELANRQDVSTRRIRLQWSSRAVGQLWLHYTRHRNPLFQDHEDDRIMLTYQRKLGGGSLLPLYAVEDEAADGEPGTAGEPTGTVEDGEGGEGEEEEEEQGFRTGYLIAGGAVAGALIASSGNSSQDEAPRTNLQHETARAALNAFNPIYRKTWSTAPTSIVILMDPTDPPTYSRGPRIVSACRHYSLPFRPDQLVPRRGILMAGRTHASTMRISHRQTLRQTVTRVLMDILVRPPASSSIMRYRREGFPYLEP